MAINVLSRNVVFHVKHEAQPLIAPRQQSSTSIASVALSFGLLLGGCDAAPSEPPAAAVATEKASHQSDYGQLLVETDLRRHDAALAIAFLHGDTEHRIAAARGLSLVGGDAALALLQRGLVDPAAAVRAEVSFGIALAGLPLDAWLGAYAVEPDAAVKALMTRDLGRALDLPRAGPLLRALDGPHAKEACGGITQVLRRDPQLPLEHVRRLQRLAGSADPATGVLCLTALASVGRAALAPVSSDLLEQSAAGLRHASPEVRLAWVRVLVALGPAAATLLVGAADDPEPSVAATALEQVARLGSAQFGAVTSAFEARLVKVLAGPGSAADPVVLHAALDAVPALGRSAEVAGWLGTVVERLSPRGETSPQPGIAALHCAAARAYDRVREWPTRSIGCGGAGHPAWVGQVAALEVLSAAASSDALRASQLRRLYQEGDWHVRRSAMIGAQGLPVELAEPLVLLGLTSDHDDVRAAAVHTVAQLAPRLRRGAASLPPELVISLRGAFQEFHVKAHVAGLRGWLSVVRSARLRSELGGVTVLARSGIAPVREDARELLSEWGHPVPTESPDAVPDPIPRDQLVQSPRSVTLRMNDATATMTLDPAHAPITVARVIQWLGTGQQTLEVSDWRPGQYVRVSDATGITSTAWRSEESRAPLTRGTVVVPQRGRDGVSAALLILLAPAPELEEHVAVVGQINPDDLGQFDRLTLGDTIRTEVAAK